MIVSEDKNYRVFDVTQAQMDETSAENLKKAVDLLRLAYGHPISIDINDMGYGITYFGPAVGIRYNITDRQSE